MNQRRSTRAAHVASTFHYVPARNLIVAMLIALAAMSVFFVAVRIDTAPDIQLGI